MVHGALHGLDDAGSVLESHHWDGVPEQIHQALGLVGPRRQQNEGRANDGCLEGGVVASSHQQHGVLQDGGESAVVGVFAQEHRLQVSALPAGFTHELALTIAPKRSAHLQAPPLGEFHRG
ncbi:MAG: hypothetical protein N2109_10445 [Fimbriimonadales bacterium]|nr:hypothetical protein [Fimbriimonadales bacterium]